MPLFRFAVAVPLLVTMAQAPFDSSSPLSRQDAERFQRKIARIVDHSGSPARAGGVRQTPISEAEVNAYLHYEAPPLLPPGVSAPSIAMLGDDRLQGRVVLDVEAMARQREDRSTLDPLRYLSGRVPVAVVGRLRAAGGVGRFELEGATVSGVPVPPSLLQELLGYYSRTPENPEGVRFDQAFELPLGIRAIRVADRGRAVVVQ